MPKIGNFQNIIVRAAIRAVAFLYSSVRHGGATGYLAAMAGPGIATALARPGALWLNCACWRFQRAEFFDGKVSWPFAATSVPCAWLGSRLHLGSAAYALALGVNRWGTVTFRHALASLVRIAAGKLILTGK